MPGPKILTLDIETSPALAYVWRLWKENIPLQRLVETGEVISFAAKWYEDSVDQVKFYSIYHDDKYSMIQAAHSLLDEADFVVTYNGKKFDIPHINREILLSGSTPPSPYSQIDLYQVIKKTFMFTSNKLDHVSEQLEIGNKVEHAGFQLWVDCMAFDPTAWEQMKEYNMHDVVLTEQLYTKLRPWISGHPHFNLFTEDGASRVSCPACGSENLQSRGKARTAMSTYNRYQCQDCGKWTRGNSRTQGVVTTSIKG